MPLTVKQIEEQREQAQENLRCLLDGICANDRDTEAVIDNACEIVVKAMNILRDELVKP